jgi:fucose 4-O-acetylase-like acetyltransferase
MNQIEKLSRNENIDFLRFIGLAMIILAHVEPTALVFQLRNFDVPLMVLLSGMSFSLAIKKEPFTKYVWKRIKRLVFPVWIFLTLYFLINYVTDMSLGSFSYKEIVTSYLLISGIGYVWIIRVFLMMALLSPFINSINEKIRNDIKYLLLLTTILILFEVFRYFLLPYTSHGIGKPLSLLFFDVVPYALIFGLGLRLQYLKSKTIHILFLLSSTLFISIAYSLTVINGHFVPTQDFKYPPSIYFLSYALSISIALWLLVRKYLAVLDKLKLVKDAIMFIAQNSIWVYLWHIPFITLIHLGFVTKYILVFAIASILTFIQIKMINNLILPNISKESIRKNTKMILTG